MSNTTDELPCFVDRERGHVGERVWPWRRENVAVVAKECDRVGRGGERVWPWRRESVAVEARKCGRGGESVWPWRRESVEVVARECDRVGRGDERVWSLKCHHPCEPSHIGSGSIDARSNPTCAGARLSYISD